MSTTFLSLGGKGYMILTATRSHCGIFREPLRLHQIMLLHNDPNFLCGHNRFTRCYQEIDPQHIPILISSHHSTPKVRWRVLGRRGKDFGSFIRRKQHSIPKGRIVRLPFSSVIDPEIPAPIFDSCFGNHTPCYTSHTVLWVMTHERTDFYATVSDFHRQILAERNPGVK